MFLLTLQIITILSLRKFYNRVQSFSSNIVDYFNPLQTNVSFRHPLKTSENQWFSDVFRGYRNGTLYYGALFKRVIFTKYLSEACSFVKYNFMCRCLSARLFEKFSHQLFTEELSTGASVLCILFLVICEKENLGNIIVMMIKKRKLFI